METGKKKNTPFFKANARGQSVTVNTDGCETE